jgi:pseudomonalisin/xanthomonalisin
VPDIAFDADPHSGAEIIINGSASGNIIGGTSLAAPLFTGFWARILANHSGSLAYPASAFYKYFPTLEKTVMHDVSSGSNGSYSAKAGWDYATGFGSFNVSSLSSFVNANSGF